MTNREILKRFVEEGTMPKEVRPALRALLDETEEAPLTPGNPYWNAPEDAEEGE